jgi:hypothetical protein
MEQNVNRMTLVVAGVSLIASCTSSTMVGGNATQWQAALSGAPFFDDQAALGLALNDGLPRQMRSLFFCKGKKVTVDVVLPPGLAGAGLREFAQATSEARAVQEGCVVARGGETSEGLIRVLLHAWGWQAEGYETVTTRSLMSIDIAQVTRHRGRVRARADVEVQAFVGDDIVIDRNLGSTPWLNLANGANWPAATLPVVNAPPPAVGTMPSDGQN